MKSGGALVSRNASGLRAPCSPAADHTFSSKWKVTHSKIGEHYGNEAALEEGEKTPPQSKPLAFGRVDIFHAPSNLPPDRLGFLSEAKDEGSFHNG
jgi:hypothetical protein